MQNGNFREGIWIFVLSVKGGKCNSIYHSITHNEHDDVHVPHEVRILEVAKYLDNSLNNSSPDIGEHLEYRTLREEDRRPIVRRD